MVIRRVGVWSVARLYGAIAASFGLLVGGLVAVGSLAGGMAGLLSSSEFGVRSGGLGAMFGIFAIIGLPIFYGVMGVIAGGIGAALYNLFAGILGGVEVELDSGPPGFNSQFFAQKADS